MGTKGLPSTHHSGAACLHIYWLHSSTVQCRQNSLLPTNCSDREVTAPLVSLVPSELLCYADSPPIHPYKLCLGFLAPATAQQHPHFKLFMIREGLGSSFSLTPHEIPALPVFATPPQSTKTPHTCLSASILSSQGEKKSCLASRHPRSYKVLLTAVMNQSQRHINNDTKRHIYC